MIVHTIIPAGGLGNRIRVILSALQWQYDTGNKVRILWAKDEGCACSFEKLFQPIKELKDVNNLLGFKFYRKVYLHSPIKCVYAYNYNEYAELREWVKNPKGILYSSSYSNFYIGKEPKYHDVFKLIPSLRKRLEDFSKDIDKFTIGIHIRRTDNLVSIENSPLSAFYDYIDDIVKNDDKAKFYLATDDMEVKSSFIDKFGDRIITMNCPLCRDTEDGIVFALLELYALSLCSKIIGSYYSSFSELAAQIGNIPLEIIKE